FFFQAEDGIRDFHVTGVQTCALPILARTIRCAREPAGNAADRDRLFGDHLRSWVWITARPMTRRTPAWQVALNGVFPASSPSTRSEERRVGKEWSCRRTSEDDNRNCS